MAEAPQGAAAGHVLERDTLLVRGPDRKTWLDGLLTCAVVDVAPGAAGYGLLLTKQGKIVSDVFLADSGSELFLGLPPGRGALVQQLLDRYLVMEDAELSAPTAPLTWRLAARASDEQPQPAALAGGKLTLRDLPATLQVAPASAVGSEGAAGDSALGALLAQHGLGAFGVDFGERDNPHEASLDRVAISWTKGCYLGQEVVCMQDMRGKVKRRLVPLAGPRALLEASLPVGSEGPSVLGGDGAPIGHVTSIHPSPSGSALLLASISTAALETAAELSVLGEPVRVVAG